MARETTVRDELRRPGRPSGADESRLALVIVASPVQAAVGTIIEVGRGPVVLERVARGRAEDPRMSRYHATAERTQGGQSVVVRDGVARDGGWTQSANGTWVGHTPLEDGTDFLPGQRFRTGRTLWMVVRNPCAPAENTLLDGVSESIDRARVELELVTTQVALRLERGQRVTQALLVTGPRGTGKQAVAREAARMLAAKRQRRDVPFRQVAAPALADGTTAADLFGVVDRYATDVKGRAGYFEQAHGGVLLLDEIGDTPIAEQAKLLNVLQEREVVPLGGKAPVPFDCLVIAATNRDLAALAREGRFREDLVDRLGRFVIDLPPLASRPEDVAVVAAALLRRHGFDGPVDWEAMQVLLDLQWSGNVRELETLVERAVAVLQLGGHDELDLDVLSRAAPPVARTSSELPASSSPKRQQPTREELLAALTSTGWNKTEVGRRYGKHPRQVARWMEYLKIERPEGD